MNNGAGEKQIILGDISDEQAKSVMLANQESFSANSIAEGVPKFTKVEGYTSFLAEFALIDNDIVVHFFETSEHPATDTNYWLVLFPSVLDHFAQGYFQATAPRLTAKYTEEMKSWWLKAQGYSHLLDLDAFMTKFFENLDAALEFHQKQ